jgi:hypothetical protein
MTSGLQLTVSSPSGFNFFLFPLETLDLVKSLVEIFLSDSCLNSSRCLS